MQVGPYAVSTPMAAIVLGIVLVVGVFAGRAKPRWTLLVGGLIAVLALGIVVTATVGVPPGADSAAEIAALYQVALPLAVAFTAGWLCARGSWQRRLLVIGVAAILLATFPYAAAGRATAQTLLDSPEVHQ